jgi:hypothetical protein
MLVHSPVDTAPPAPLQEHDLDASAGHLLRLCLDLQLDALLLTLGALAADRAGDTAPHQSPGRRPVVAGTVPWHRWVSEDVDLACRLAAESLAGSASLPPSLGFDARHAVPATTIDDLVARYTAMLDLLRDLSSHTAGIGSDGLGEAIARTEARLAELLDYRLALTSPAAVDLRSAHRFLPGELLG